MCVNLITLIIKKAKKGHIAIPKQIHDKLHLKEGDWANVALISHKHIDEHVSKPRVPYLFVYG